MRKKMVPVLLALASVPVFAQVIGAPQSGIMAIFEGIGNILTYFFGLKFLGVNDPMLVSAFIRACLWMLFFILVYAGTGGLSSITRQVNGQPVHFLKLNKAARVIISLCIAFIAAFNISTPVILGIGGLFGAFTGLAIILLPLIPIGIVFLFFWTDESRWGYAMKGLLVLLSIWLFSIARPLFLGEVSVAGQVSVARDAFGNVNFSVTTFTVQNMFQAVGEFIDILIVVLVFMLLYYIFKVLTAESQPQGPGQQNSPGNNRANNQFANTMDDLGFRDFARKYRIGNGLYSADDLKRDLERSKDELMDVVNVTKEMMNEIKRGGLVADWIEDAHINAPNRSAPVDPAFPWANLVDDQKKADLRRYLSSSFRRLVLSPAIALSDYEYNPVAIRGVVKSIVDRIPDLEKMKRNTQDQSKRDELDDMLKKLERFSRSSDGLLERFKSLDESVHALPELVAEQAVKKAGQLAGCADTKARVDLVNKNNGIIDFVDEDVEEDLGVLEAEIKKIPGR